MKTLKLDDIKDSRYNDFSIMDINGNLRLKYKDDDFIIDTETQFKECCIYRQNDIPKVKMVFNNDSHKLLESINLLYDKISHVIEEDDNINISRIINPIYKSKNEMIFSIINKKTIIKNTENDEVMELEILNNRTFNIYPVLYLNFKIYNEDLYINSSFHTIFIKLVKEKNYNDINIDYKKIKEIMNK